MLGQRTVGVAQIAKGAGLTQQTVCRIKNDPVRLLWLPGGCEPFGWLRNARPSSDRMA